MARRNDTARSRRPGTRGLPRSPARGHAELAARRIKARPPIDDPRIEAAILQMDRKVSMSAAARAAHISRQRLLKFLVKRRLVKHKGRRWFLRAELIRRVLIITSGRPRVIWVCGYEAARLIGEYQEAVKKFLASNDIGILKPFEGVTVRAVSGRQYVLETGPNALHRIAAMDSPQFHEIYEITSHT